MSDRSTFIALMGISYVSWTTVLKFCVIGELDTRLIEHSLAPIAHSVWLNNNHHRAIAIRTVFKGYTQLAPGIVQKMIAKTPRLDPQPLPDLPPGFADLTRREREVLRLIAAGSSNREIAQTLYISEGTVRNHVTNILARLELRDRTQAAIFANSLQSSFLSGESPLS